MGTLHPQTGRMKARPLRLESTPQTPKGDTDDVAVLAGLFRTTELHKPVDATGEIIDSGDPALDGPVTNAIEMIRKLAESERVEQVFVRHAFRFWMGRNETLNDAPVLQAAHKAYRDNGGSMKALIISLVTSDAFLYRKVDRNAKTTALLNRPK